jgi:hypothetical protein
MFVAVAVMLMAMASAQLPRKCDMARQTPAFGGAWGMPKLRSCALEVNVTVTLPDGHAKATAATVPIHVLDCAHGVFSPVMDVFSAPLRLAPAGNERLCYDLKKDEHLGGSAVVIERGLCTMWKKVRTAVKAGASAVIVAENTDTSVLGRMRASKPSKNEANALPLIPAIMISKASGAHLQGFLNGSSLNGSSLGGGGKSGGMSESIANAPPLLVEATIRASYEQLGALHEEVQTWSRVLRAAAAEEQQQQQQQQQQAKTTTTPTTTTTTTTTTLPGAMTMLQWVLRRAGWRDDALRAEAYASKLAAKMRQTLKDATPSGSSGLPSHDAEQKHLLGALQAKGYEPAQADFPLPDQLNVYQRMAALYPRVCEVGVHNGFSALAFLQAGARSYSGFALGSAHPDIVRGSAQELAAAKLTEVAAGALGSMYGERFHAVWGDPTESLAALVEEGGRQSGDRFQCDLMLIDRAGARTGRSLKLFAKLAATDHLVVMTHTPCAPEACLVPTRVYEQAEHTGELASLHRQHFSLQSGQARALGYSVAQYAAESSELASRRVVTAMGGETYDSMVKEEMTRMDEEYLGFDKNRKRMGSSEELEELKKHSDPEFVKRAEEFRAEDERVKARRRKRMLEAQKAKEQMLAEAKEKEAAEAAAAEAAEAAEEEQKGERQEHVAKEKETESNEDAKSGNGKKKKGKKKPAKSVDVDDLMAAFSERFVGE